MKEKILSQPLLRKKEIKETKENKFITAFEKYPESDKYCQWKSKS